MPSSMIAIFMPCPAVASVGPPDGRRADHLRRPVEQRVVADARPDLRDPGDACELVELGARDDDGEAVEHDAEAPAHAGGGNRGVDPRLQRTLRDVEAPQVVPARRRARAAAGCGRANEEKASVPCRAKTSASGGDFKVTTHLDVAGVRRRRQTRARSQTADQETPSQARESVRPDSSSPLGERTNLPARRVDRSRDAWLDCASARMWRNW